MLQAWMVLPALAVGYLVSAPARLRRRPAHLGAAAVVMLAVSLSWIALYTFTPAGRPPLRGRVHRQQRDRDGLRLQRPWSGSASPFSGAVTSGPGVTSGNSGGGGPPGATSTAPRASGTTAAPAGTGGDTGTGASGSAQSGAPGSGTGSALPRRRARRPGGGTGTSARPAH